MDLILKRLLKLEELLKSKKKKTKKEKKRITMKKLETIMGKMFPNRPRLLTQEKKEEKKEAPTEAPKAEAPA